MGLHKLTAGDGYTYLTRQVAAHDTSEKGSLTLGDYYSEKGESPGQWLGTGLESLGLRPGDPVSEEQMKSLFGHGRHPNADQLEAAVTAKGGSLADAVAAGALGRRFNVYDACAVFQVQVAREFTSYNTDRGRSWNTAIPPAVRAGIRTLVATRMFTKEQGRAPQDARELSGFIARASRQRTTAVAGYDLTFSPVKSVSTLWALAPAPVAAQLREAHDAAVADTMGWLEREVAFTRVGRAGTRQVPVRGLVATAFTHRDSRAGDPDLHTHVAVSNKVQTQDGRWLALDARVLYRAKVAASERYNTRLEAEVAERLGVRFADRATTRGLRPVREIVGVNSLLTGWWSARRRDIEHRRATLATEFQTHHGRPPTAIEALALAQQATLETRQAKHLPRSEAEQRAQWRREANDVLGGEAEVASMIRRTLGHRTRSGGERATTAWVNQCAAQVVATMEESRASWRIWHVQAEAERRGRYAGIRLLDLDTAVDQVVGVALEKLSIRLGTPDPIREPTVLRRANGESMYEVHGDTSYTSGRVLLAEQRLLSAATATGGRRISEVRVGIAIAEEAANGIALTDAQSAMVKALATSGLRLQLALAPAGTGKTTAMRVLGRAWTDAGGYVLGLAPSAQAAHELGHVLEGHTDTLAKLTWTLANEPRERWPGWVTLIGSRTLVIIDEAGAAGTTELAAAVDYVTGRGGTVRLVGDDQQLASVGAGGVLRDIAHTAGAVTLSEVRRFHDPAEAAATLAVREGDASALGFYADNARIHVGDLGAVTDQAYLAWAADRRAGLDSILLAPTRELVTQLNTRARQDLVDHRQPVGAQVRLTDGTRASVGDTVVTRRNDRRLPVSESDWVKNGDRWRVESVRDDGAVTVRHLDHRRTVLLPAEYVAEHVQLGYATTVHAAQGMTTDTAHVVVAGQESRQLLYVALSRGRAANHLYLATAHDGDPHSLVRPETLAPPTAIDVLADILARDGSQHSATSTRRDLDSPAAQLHGAATRYHDALGVAATDVLGADQQTTLNREIEAIWPGLTSEPAYPTLSAHLTLAALTGLDPFPLLMDVADAHELSTAEDRAAVLDWRLSTQLGEHSHGPLPWLAGIPEQLQQHRDWGPYLHARENRVRTLARSVRLHAYAWSPVGAPDWGAKLTAPGDTELRADLAVWRASFGVPENDTRPTGPRQPSTDATAHQRNLERRIRHLTRTPAGANTTQWGDLIPAFVGSGAATTRLHERLDSLSRAGLDVTSMLTNALAEPRPLPDEHAADALWWRIVRHLGPATLRAHTEPDPHLRPTWTPALRALVGTEAAERVMADPAWPALVAAVHARPEGWDAEQLLTAACDPRGSEVAVEDLCEAMVWRVATLTDVPDDIDEADLPPDPLDDTRPPEDLHATDLHATDLHAKDLHASDPPASSPAATPPITGTATGTSVGRILELNRAALAFYLGMYPRSWAPDYLQTRLGTDLVDDPRYTVGYAPPGPTSLIGHLTATGATDQELLDAGLARRTDRGNLVDAFRDRLLFPIQSTADDVVGFIGRRNPTKDESEYAGPKYLNTRTTAAFTKGEQLYGLTEATQDLDAGALPVVVEGPLDAIAITLGTRGNAVGIAPLGTALTEHQAQRLRSLTGEHPSRLAVGTDPDPAGWLSAQRAFWRLAQHGADPLHIAWPEGLDPADLLRTQGPGSVAVAVATARPLATSIIDSLIESSVDMLDSPATRLRLVRQSGEVIGALPPERWRAHIERVTDQLGLPAGMLHLEVIDAGEAWTEDPTTAATQRLAALNAKPKHPWSTNRSTDRPTDRWRTQLEDASPGISHTPDWPALAATLVHAHAQGYDVPALLTANLITPLDPHTSPATHLRLRINAAIDHSTRHDAPHPPPVTPPRPSHARPETRIPVPAPAPAPRTGPSR